jgi:hypothetical protein
VSLSRFSTLFFSRSKVFASVSRAKNRGAPASSRTTASATSILQKHLINSSIIHFIQLIHPNSSSENSRPTHKTHARPIRRSRIRVFFADLRRRLHGGPRSQEQSTSHYIDIDVESGFWRGCRCSPTVAEDLRGKCMSSLWLSQMPIARVPPGRCSAFPRRSIGACLLQLRDGMYHHVMRMSERRY